MGSKSKSSLESTLNRAATLYIENGTIHGLNWFPFISNERIQNVCFFSVMLCSFLLPTFLVKEAISFFNDLTIKSTVEYQTADVVAIPNVTICHPNYFSLDKMNKLNVSNLLANYMVLGINPNSARTASKNRELQGKLVQAEVELREKLNETGLNFPGLVRAIAIDMNDFLVLCETPNPENLSDNCSTIFENEPFFSPNAGICWTSKWNFPMRVVYRTTSIKIWTNIRRSKSLELDFEFHQTNAVERLPPFFNLPLHNHPSGAIRVDPLKLSLGQTMSIEMLPFVMDRTKLSEHIFAKPKDVCVKNNEIFEDLFKMPYTKINCANTLGINQPKGCSLNYLDGYPKSGNQRPCEPLDILEVAPAFRGSAGNSSFQSLVANANSAQNIGGLICPSKCIETGIEKFIITGKGNFDILSKALSRSYPSNDVLLAEDFSGLELFYASMDYSTTFFYRDGVGVFLSRIGGWLGLAIGASLLSLLELLVFFIYLCRLLCKTIAGQK